jgi:membrane protein implicated in regulation of membrane protease activity
MSFQIKFEPVTVVTDHGSEHAQLVWADRHLVAVLVPAEAGWFLQIGFGPCTGEGVLFATTEAAAAWVHHRMMQERAASPAAKRKASDPADTTLPSG